MNGCPWAVEMKRVWNRKTKRHDASHIFCHKLSAEGSPYCPRHKAMDEHNRAQQNEPQKETYTEGR